LKAFVQNHRRRSRCSNGWVLSLLLKTASVSDGSRMDAGRRRLLGSEFQVRVRMFAVDLNCVS